jgi:hypothetical protein
MSTFDYIIKWLLISTKETVRYEEDGELVEKTMVNFRRAQKMKFMQELLRCVNKNEHDQETLSNIAVLFEQMLSNPN